MTAVADTATFFNRFWPKVDKRHDGCWQWIGAVADTGYGKFWVGPPFSRVFNAHKASYMAFVGEVPKGLDLDHLCRNRACVNPEHLEPVTRKENLARGEVRWAINARNGTCHAGHPLEGENLRIEADGVRRCVECRRISNAVKWQRAKAG